MPASGEIFEALDDARFSGSTGTRQEHHEVAVDRHNCIQIVIDDAYFIYQSLVVFEFGELVGNIDVLKQRSSHEEEGVVLFFV